MPVEWLEIFQSMGFETFSYRIIGALPNGSFALVISVTFKATKDSSYIFYGDDLDDACTEAYEYLLEVDL